MPESFSSFNTKTQALTLSGFSRCFSPEMLGKGLWTLKESQQGQMGTGKGDNAGVWFGRVGSAKLPVQSEAGM